MRRIHVPFIIECERTNLILVGYQEVCLISRSQLGKVIHVLGLVIKSVSFKILFFFQLHGPSIIYIIVVASFSQILDSVTYSKKENISRLGAAVRLMQRRSSLKERRIVDRKWTFG